MIHRKVIDEIYRKYRKRPKNEKELHMHILTDVFGDMDILKIEGNEVIFIPKEPTDIERRLEISHIHGVIEFDRHVAIVLPASIIFITKTTGDINVHIKVERPSLLERIRLKLGI